jgi:benzodiazapine receptor
MAFAGITVTAVGLAKLLPLGLGMASGASVRSKIDPWYHSLRKSRLTPPGWVFPVVWTTLYLMQGHACARIMEIDPTYKRTRLHLALFGVQLVLNLAWSPTFFGARRPREALAISAGLWTAVLTTTLAFWDADRTAGLLFVPYMGWATLASYLNWFITEYNPNDGAQ